MAVRRKAKAAYYVCFKLRRHGRGDEGIYGEVKSEAAGSSESDGGTSADSGRSGIGKNEYDDAQDRAHGGQWDSAL